MASAAYGDQDTQSIPDVSETTSQQSLPEPLKCNLQVSFELANYDPSFHIMVLALEHCCMGKAMSVAASVPWKFVDEAASSFSIRDKESFTFSVNGKKKLMSKSKFFKLLHLSVPGDLDIPLNMETFEMINEMGHTELVYMSSQVYMSKLPDIWLLFYNLVINSLLGIVPSKGKINMNQMLVMYGVYYNKNVGIAEFVWSEFVNECKSKIMGEINIHRYWSVIVDDVLKKDCAANIR